MIDETAFLAISDRLRRADRARFLAVQFVESKYRADLLGLFEFNLELRDACDGVSEPAIGQLRLKWWYDALAGIFDGHPPRHPVAVGLAEIVSRRGLKQVAFEQWLEAVADGLAAGRADQVVDAETRIENTTGALFDLSLAVVGIDDGSAHEAGGWVARGCGLVEMLRSTAVEAARGRFNFPQDLCKRHGFDGHAVLRWRPGDATPPGLVEAVGEIAARAAHCLQEARRMRDQIPKRALPLFLGAVAAESGLRRLAKRGNDPLTAPVLSAQPEPWLVARMTWAAWRKTY